ncbi:MAG TPA: hypothetical protein VFM05_12595, partial [Candidatus Saccharimonadales bacterium]|nr:hypothetical protein [Candidatus Saccharimonadales bacterium]
MREAIKPILDAHQKICQIRNLLRQSGYTESRIRQLLGVEALPLHRQRRSALSRYLWRARGGSPLNILCRLFLLRQSTSVDDLRGVIEPADIEDWIDVGLLRVEGDDVIASVELCPYQNLMLAADWPDGDHADLHQVMGIAASS